MFSRLKKQFKELSPLGQFILIFLGNCLYWFIAWQLGETFFFDEKRSILYHILHALWMGAVWTAIFNWKELKAAFRRKGREEAETRGNG